jgi:hypothetical protein
METEFVAKFVDCDAQLQSNHGPPALQAASAAHQYPRIAPLMSLDTDQKNWTECT